MNEAYRRKNPLNQQINRQTKRQKHILTQPWFQQKLLDAVKSEGQIWDSFIISTKFEWQKNQIKKLIISGSSSYRYISGSCCSSYTPR